MNRVTDVPDATRVWLQVSAPSAVFGGRIDARPTILLMAEGGVGSRQAVLVSLHYDVLTRLQ